MPSSITNSGLTTTYNSRGLVTHNANTRQLVRTSTGVLYAVIRENKIGDYINLYRSVTDGFSWERLYSGPFVNSAQRKSGFSNLNHQGNFMMLTMWERFGVIILWHSYKDITTGKYDVEPQVFNMQGQRLEPDADFPSQLTLDIDELAFDFVHNQNTGFLVYVSYSKLRVHEYRPTGFGGTVAQREQTGDFYNVFAANADAFGLVDIAILAAGNPHTLRHFRYNQATGAFTGPHEIAKMPGQTDVFDPAIVKDIHGNILCVWSEHNVAGDDVRAKYAISHDDGATWGDVVTVPREPGHTVFRDGPSSKRAARTTAMAGHRGFLIGYVTRDENEVAKAFVRQLTTEEGEEYELGPARKIGIQAQEHEHITGVRFFNPPQPQLQDIDDPSTVRIAYNIGRGNSQVLNDSVPVRIGQELLGESAFPSPLPSQEGSYEEDEVTDEGEHLVEFTVMGGPSNREDYFDIGMVGVVTYRYISAFNKVGIETRLLKYEPLAYSELNDRSAYGRPEEFNAKIVIDPKSYEYPLAPRGQEGHREFMERDIRTVYFPANLFLGRNRIVNQGGHLKRTVWTMQFDGNTYEVTQIIPYFIDGVIAYYKANAYVVGASHDPFSKAILPSES